MATELSDNERALLAREVAADGYRPSSVADEEDIRRVPRDAFVAGWDAAMAHVAKRDHDDDGYELGDATVASVLHGPTDWNKFVDELHIRRSYD